MCPTVSVIIPSYNHERYIRECIQSVLDQTFQDFEIVITDDGSIDDSVRLIESFDDPRITLYRHSRNLGACIAANNCIRRSKGKYIAMLSSDDVWYPTKLDIQVKYLDEHPEIAAVFGKVDWIDESSNLYTNKNLPFLSLFEVENRTRFEWLRYFFLTGNCLCHPCSLIRRDDYNEVGLLNPAYASLPDLDLWIRICLKHEIWIQDQKLIKFRKIRDESNASGNTAVTLTRNRFEHRHSLDHYLSITDPDELLRIFPDAKRYGEITPETIPYFLGRTAIDTGMHYKIQWGLDLIYRLLQDRKMAQAINENSHFGYRDFINFTAEYDPFGLFAYLFLGRTPPKAKFHLGQRIFQIILPILIRAKRACPAWVKILMKSGVSKIRPRAKLYSIIKRLVPEPIKRLYYMILAS